jgi:hypothetical protein
VSSDLAAPVNENARLMRTPVLLTIVAALVALVIVVIAGQQLLQPNLPLITQAAFSPETITPNADGVDDVTLFTYSLSRNAQVSVTFQAEDGTVYAFRENEVRSLGDYQVLFSGVVGGYTLPQENIDGEVLRRLIPDGAYTWKLTAVAEDGALDERSGTFVVQNADSPLPELVEFTVSPQVFTPNQDGISDRTQVNVYLAKEADLSVYLQGENDARIFIPERLEGRKPGEAGRHIFDYEGGVDLGADPPPDGSYTVVAEAQDAVGQVIRRSAELTIQEGGKPLAEIVGQPSGVTVVFDVQPYDERYASTPERLGVPIAPPDDAQDLTRTALTLPVGDILVFKLTVENYSDVPLRTSGPPPGTVYEQTQRASTLNWFDESGAWRVGIDCTTADADYPWRWALGTENDLVEQVDPDSGNTYTYLPPGAQVVVWGGIRMTEIEARNPQNCWAGLIHEDVEVSLRNSNVGAREVELVALTEEAES